MKQGFTPFSIKIIKDNLQEFIKSYEDDFLDGAPLTRIISQNKYFLDDVLSTRLVGNNAAGINSYHIFIIYKKQNYLIYFNENEKIQKAMLSTFKFIK